MRGFALLFACLLLCAPGVHAQEKAASVQLVDAPSATMLKSGIMIRPVPAAKPVREPHRFFDKTNLALMSASFLGQTADAITTQRGLAHGRHEVNPIAKPFVERGWPGQVGLAVIVNSSQMGAMYFAHRRGHHKVERFLPIAIGVASGFFAHSNLQMTR